ncbi:MAG: serine/threonine protein kinase, partial [Frankiales bacterium]|nr:serine/threonine protein kinase [Frankiales bacterium]
MTATSPLVAGRYRLVRELGRGGMGVVWEAFDELLHRSVAVKEVHFPAELPEADRERLAGRTLQEARAVAALDTAAAVRVYDIVEQDTRPWLVMELVRGTTLIARVSEQGALPEQDVARIGLALVDALEAAHAAGVLHRDVKPSNVLLGEDGRVALTDFGIATIEGDSREATTGVVLGSPSYVAPERLAGDRPSAASDYWALGATLWTALEGRQPYDGATAYAVLSAVTTSEPPLCTRCSPAMQELLRSLMARNPLLRPPAASVRARLEQVASGPEPALMAPTLALPLPEHFDRTTVLDARPPAADPAPPAPPAP